MANALSSLISDSSHVFIMGHKSPDNDVVGAAPGCSPWCRKNGVPAHIMREQGNNPAQELTDKLLQLPEYHDCFLLPQEALLIADNRSLVVVVDTNRPEQVQAPEVLQSCNRVAVIDHHRRAATYIEGAALNYHEPYASSASEMVTELLQYIIEPNHLLGRRPRPCWRASCWTPRTSPCAPEAAPSRRRPSCAGPGPTPPR